jgi:hypothetical protein
MTTNLKYPDPPQSDTDKDGGDGGEQSFYLDAFAKTALTPKLMELTKEVNRDSCENAAIIKTRAGRFFLLWEERHPENVSLFEYCVGKPKPESVQDLADYYEQSAPVGMSYPAGYWKQGYRNKRREYNELCKKLPPKECELPLTRKQALALLVAHHLRPDGAGMSEQPAFAAEIEGLLAY